MARKFRCQLLTALVGAATTVWLLGGSAVAQIGPTSANDKATSQNQDPNPKNPTKPPRVNTGIGSPDTPTDSLLNEGSPPISADAPAVFSDGQNARTQPNQTAGASGNFGFQGGSLQTLRLSELLNRDIQLQGGHGVGSVSDVVLNQNGNVLYLLGTNATNQQMFTIPAQAINFDSDNLALTLSLSQQQFQTLPMYPSTAIPNFSSLAYQQQLYTAYGLAGANVSNGTNVGAGRNNGNVIQNAANGGQNQTPGATNSTPNNAATTPAGVRRPPLDQPAHTQGNSNLQGNPKRNPTANNPAANNPAAANAKAGRTPAGTPIPNSAAGNAAQAQKPAAVGPGRVGNTPVNPPAGTAGPGGATPKANPQAPAATPGAAPAVGNPNPGGAAGGANNPR